MIARIDIAGAFAKHLAQFGEGMAAHRRVILGLQWAIVVFYAVLVVLPAFLPHPHPNARLVSDDYGASSLMDPNYCVSPGKMPLVDMAPRITPWHERLVLLAQYLFWGVWWPFVILSTMFLGRVWCGVLCPEGALSELASRHGRGWPIPKWMRWAGWPFVAFVLTTIYGQLISVYEYPQAALLILGGSTVVAVVVGYLYGKGKRVWCRYLCPVSGVFALLARLSPVHFRVDREAWQDYPARIHAVDCAPLLNVKKLDGMAQCHACGRCSGHRNAVVLAARSPDAEILQGETPRTVEAVLLLFGLLGVAIGAFLWTVSPWFVRMKQVAAEWLVDHEVFWMLDESPAWWLLTRYPEASDVFSFLDGAAILVWISGFALVLGGFSFLSVRLAARLSGLDWRRLTMGLVPLAGISLFLGLSMMTVTHLRAEGVSLFWLPWVRGMLLAVGVIGSLWLGWHLIKASKTAWYPLVSILWCLPIIAVCRIWVTIF